MRVFLFLLLAVSTSVAHHVQPTPTPAVQSSPSAEDRAARAETDTAFWTKQLAWATVILAFVTASATVADIVWNNWLRNQDRQERINERDADALERKQDRTYEEDLRVRLDHDQQINALLELEQVIWFFNRRCQMLDDDTALSAEILMRGFDAAMSNAFTPQLLRPLTEELIAQVYGAIFEAHDALAYAAVHQASRAGRSGMGDIMPSPVIAAKARTAQLATAQAAKLVRERRELLKAVWQAAGQIASD